MSTPILEMKNITKTFPGVKALDEVSFRVAEAEIHGLVGENGAGKSTLMKVLSGVHQHGAYTGEILLRGEPQEFHTRVTVRRLVSVSSTRNWRSCPK